VRRVGFAALFVLGFGLAGTMAAAVVAETTPTTTTTVTTGTTTAATTTAPTTTAATTTVTTQPKPLQLPTGVRIAGVPVGGLSPEAADALLRASFAAPVTVIAARHRLSPTPRQLGAVAYFKGAVDRARAAAPNSRVDLVVAVHGATLRRYVDRIAKRIDRPAVDAKLALRLGSPFITRERPGLELDRAAATRALVKALHENRRAPVRLPTHAVLPETTRTSFASVIVIHRSANRLDLYHGTRPARTFGIATGQSIYPTPLGRFLIVVRWANPWWYPPASPWAHGLKPVPPGPGNPLGTRWLGLSAPGVGIHGTPDDASIGYSASHGCIRMHISDAEWLFDHVAVGTTVFIV
jgi:lipoprotein-anchoring transpeptidase ErfK/SrfK